MFSEDLARFLAEVIRQKRKSQNLSQEDLAERADVSSKMVSLIERYERNPSVNLADSIARALKVPLWRLVKEAEDLRQKQPQKKK